MVKKSQKGKVIGVGVAFPPMISHHLPSTRRNEEPASGNTPGRNSNMSSFHFTAQSLEDSWRLSAFVTIQNFVAFWFFWFLIFY